MLLKYMNNISCTLITITAITRNRTFYQTLGFYFCSVKLRTNTETSLIQNPAPHNCALNINIMWALGLLDWLDSGTAVEKEIKLMFLSEHTLPEGEWPTEWSSNTTLKLCHGKSGPTCWLHTTRHLLQESLRREETDNNR